MTQKLNVIDIQALQNNSKLMFDSIRLDKDIKKKEIMLFSLNMINTLSDEISYILKPQEELTITNKKLIKDKDKSIFILVINNQTIVLYVYKSIISMKYRLDLKDGTLFFNNNPIGYDGKLKFTRLFSNILNSKLQNKFEMIIDRKGDY